jgi:DNA (cytosine-5)-methyltransferase 1
VVRIKLGLDSVLKDLESEGYRTRTFSVSASSIGANHQRERIWIVAHSECNEHQHTLKKVNGKEKEVQGKHWKENGSARKSVGADPIRETDNTDVENTRQSNGGIEPSGNTESPGRGASEKAERSADANKAARSSERAEAMADTNVEGRQGRIHRGQNKEWENQQRYFGRNSAAHGQQEQNWWDTEPDVGRVAHGIPNRVDRLKALGNSLVPKIPYYIGQSIIATYEDNDTVQTEGTSKDNT